MWKRPGLEDEAPEEEALYCGMERATDGNLYRDSVQGLPASARV